MRVRVSYDGRVQGVGFRATTREIAAGYTVWGWVRNEHDGTVTLEAQAEPAELDRFLNELKRILGRYITTHRRVDIPDAAVTGVPTFVIQR
jgi:acylphosphatase